MSSKVWVKCGYMRTLTSTWNLSIPRIHLKSLCVYKIGTIWKFLRNSTCLLFWLLLRAIYRFYETKNPLDKPSTCSKELLLREKSDCFVHRRPQIQPSPHLSPHWEAVQSNYKVTGSRPQNQLYPLSTTQASHSTCSFASQKSGWWLTAPLSLRFSLKIPKTAFFWGLSSVSPSCSLID